MQSTFPGASSIGFVARQPDRGSQNVSRPHALQTRDILDIRFGMAKSADEKRIAAFVQAMMEDDMEEAENCLNQGLDPNARTAGGWTLLHIAVHSVQKVEDNNRYGFIKLLAKKGVDVDLPFPGGYGTALLLAIVNDNVPLAKTLLECKANVDQQQPITLATPLHLAARLGREKIVKLLLSAGADVQARDFKGFTPLAYAKDSRNPRVIEMLRKVSGKPFQRKSALYGDLTYTLSVN